MKVNEFYLVKHLTSTWDRQDILVSTNPGTQILDITKEIHNLRSESIQFCGEPNWTSSAHFEISKTSYKFPNIYGVIRSYASSSKTGRTGIILREGTMMDENMDGINFTLYRNQADYELGNEAKFVSTSIVIIGTNIQRFNGRWWISGRNILFSSEAFPTVRNFLKKHQCQFSTMNNSPGGN